MTPSPETGPPEKTPPPPLGLAVKVRNFVVVSVAVVLSVLVVLGVRTQTPGASLETLAETATPLETALTNGKPSLVEFYANWCTSCQAMAGEMMALRDTYGQAVNFVMLNVDNSKWLPEMLHYRVDGIPHFVYLDDQGEPVAMAIGEQPPAVFAGNLEALIQHEALPYSQTTGQLSPLTEAPLPRTSDDPRSHGAQVVQ